MRKLYITILKVLIITLMIPIGYVVSVLLINTIADFRPQNSILEIHHASVPESDPYKNTFSIITWNIGYGGLGKNADFFFDGGKMSKPAKMEYEKYFDGIMETITAFGFPDFLLLQEVDIASARTYRHDQYHEISGRLLSYDGVYADNYKVPFVPLPLFKPMGKVHSGLALFSLHKFVSAEMHAYPGNFPWPKKLFLPDRCFIHAVYELPSGKYLHIINTHHSAFDDGSLRNEQLCMLFKHMARLFNNGDYVVAGGDWNINPPGFEDQYFASNDLLFRIKLLSPVFNEYPEWQVFYDKNLPTNRDVSMPYVHGVCPTTIIDFYICSPNIRSLEINVRYDGFANSDHHPVFMSFTTE